jgi:predicted CopG family antitoxin
MTNDNTTRTVITIDGEHLEMLKGIKEEHSYKGYAEAVRRLIVKEFKQLEAMDG